MNQLTTAEFAAVIGKSRRHVTHVLSMLTILNSAKPQSEAGLKQQAKRIKTRLNWLGDQYISHRKMTNQYLIMVKG
jgi:hypothetical protein